MSKGDVMRYMRDKFQDLISLNKMRGFELLEIIEYTILYTLITIPFSVILEKIFPNADENKGNLEILIEVILQMILIGILVFYIQKLGQLFPSIFLGMRGYKKYRSFEYEGYITIPLVFVGTQKNLLEKIHILRGRISDGIGI